MKTRKRIIISDEINPRFFKLPFLLLLMEELGNEIARRISDKLPVPTRYRTEFSPISKYRISGRHTLFMRKGSGILRELTIRLPADTKFTLYLKIDDREFIAHSDKLLEWSPHIAWLSMYRTDKWQILGISDLKYLKHIEVAIEVYEVVEIEKSYSVDICME